MDERPRVTPDQQATLERLVRYEASEGVTQRPYWSTCETCDIARTFYSADGARSFIYNHAGHKTTLQVGRKGER